MSTISDSINKIETYRPVLKVMEREVHKQFSVYLKENKLISNFQFGFRKNKSTELAAITLVEEIRQSVDSSCIVCACFLDINKAFDAISYANFFSKLTSYGVNWIELEWSRDYFLIAK